MDLIDNILFVQGKLLIKADVVKENTLMDGLRRQRAGKVHCWAYERFSKVNGEYVKHERTSRKGVVYLYFESLRDDYKSDIIKKLCYGNDPYHFAINKAELTLNHKALESREVVKKQKALERDAIATDYRNSIADVLNIKQEWITTLVNEGENSADAERKARTCGWLQLLALSTPKDVKSYGYSGKAEFKTEVYRVMADEFKQSLIMFKNSKMPSNMRVMERYVTDFKNNGVSCMLSGKIGNQNPSIIGRTDGSDNVLMVGRYNVNEWHAATIIYIYTNPGAGNKFDLRETHRRYERACVKEGVTAASRRAVERFLNDNAVQLHCIPERDGWKAMDKYLPMVHGKRVEKSLSKGGFDGFSVDFYSEVDGANMMLQVVALMDYASGAVTGYSVGLVENGLMVRQAVRNHLNNCNNMGYYELESDRFSGNLSSASKRIIEGVCKKFRAPAPNLPLKNTGKKAPANPKARYVERLLQEVNRLSQNMPAHKGCNITSVRSNSKPNPDYKMEAFKGYRAGVDAVIMLMNAYNHEVLANGKSRWDIFQENQSEKAPAIYEITRERLFWEHTTSTVRHASITIEHDGQKYEYDYAHYLDQAHLLNKGLKCRVAFDPENMEQAKIYHYEDKDDLTQDIYITTLERITEVQRAMAERTEDDVKELGKQHNKRNKAIHSLNRKFTEGIANRLGIDVGDMDAETASKVVRGAIAQQGSGIVEPFIERYKEALSRKEAQQHEDYYRQNLIPGKVIDMIPHIAKSDEEKKRELARAKLSKRKNNNRGAV